MIIRQLASRHCRIQLLSSTWKRSFATESRVDSIAASLENSKRETGAIESAINRIVPASQAIHTVEATSLQAEHDVAEVYKTRQEHRRQASDLGTTLTPFYRPHELLSKPPGPADVTLELLLAAQAHLGHATSRWHPGNQKYIFGVRQGIHIISLDVTASYLRRAARIVSGVCERGGLVLFTGTRQGQDRCVVSAARRAGGCHLFERWIPGSITNGDQILGKCRMKMVDEFDREIEGYDEQMTDAGALKPDLVVCLNPLENYVMLHECGLHNIPTIGVIDTNVDPTWVTYPIPANDDSLRAMQVIAGVLGKAGQEGQQRRLAAAQAGRLTYEKNHSFVSPHDFAVNKMADEPDSNVDLLHLAAESSE